MSLTALKLLSRGVWRAPYLVDGAPVLICVDRFGVVRKHLKLHDDVDPQRATDWLTALLDRLDPPLKLVKPAAPARPAREIDPRLYTDPRSPLAKRRYMANLVKTAARTLPRRLAD